MPSIAVGRLVGVPVVTGLALAGALLFPTGDAALAAEGSASSPAPPVVDCADILVVGARGSGEAEGLGDKVQYAVDYLDDAFDGLRDVRTVELQYPAAALSALADDLLNAATDYDWEYFASIQAGHDALSDVLHESLLGCPDEKWILVGYSQGALVIDEVLDEYDLPSRYAGIVKIADPGRVSDASRNNVGSASPGNGVTAATAWIPVSRPTPVVPADLNFLTYEICDEFDVVCDTSGAFGYYPSIPAAVAAGAEFHGAYTRAQVERVTQEVVPRALSFAVPRDARPQVEQCTSQEISGLLGTKTLRSGASGTWRLHPDYAPSGAVSISSSSFTFASGMGFTISPSGIYSGTLPLGNWEIRLQLVSPGISAVEVPLDIYLAADCAAVMECGPSGADLQPPARSDHPSYVAGRILCPDGRPAGGVTIRLYTLSDVGWELPYLSWAGTTETDKFGRYHLPLTYEGEFVVEAEHEGFATIYNGELHEAAYFGDPIAIDDDSRTVLPDFRLKDWGYFSGSVDIAGDRAELLESGTIRAVRIDDEDLNEALDGYGVWCLEDCSYWEDYGDGELLHFDSSGGFSFRAAPGTYRVYYESAGYGYSYGEWQGSDEFSWSVDDPIPADAQTFVVSERQTVELAPKQLVSAGVVELDAYRLIPEEWRSHFHFNYPRSLRLYELIGGEWVDLGDHHAGGWFDRARLTLFPGTYRLGFNVPEAEDYDPTFETQYFPSVTDFDDALSFTVAEGVTTDLGQVGYREAADPWSQHGSILGRVVDAENPTQGVPGVYVFAYCDDQSLTGPFYGVVTDARGYFHLDDYPAGECFLEYRGPEGWQTLWSGGVTDRDDAETFTVSDGIDLTGMGVALPPGSGITGHVSDTDGPGGVEGVSVAAYDLDGNWIASAGTREDGTFALTTLPPGTYRFQMTGSWDQDYVAQWWEDRARSQDADPVTLAAGEIRDDFDVVLRHGATVSGRVTGQGGVPITDGWVYLLDAEGLTIESASLGSDGEYELARLPEGSYTLQFTAGWGSPFLAEYWSDATGPESAQYFSLGAGQVVSGRDAVLLRGGTLSGVVSGDGTAGLEAAQLFLYDSSGEPVRWTTTDASGAYSITGLPAGTYKLQASPPWDSDVYAPQWYDGESSAAGATAIVVSAGQTVSGVDIELPFGAAISGRVIADGEPVADASVSVFDANGSAEPVDGGSTDEDGFYDVVGLAAGSYQVVVEVYDSPWAPEWWNDRATRAAADPITLTAGEERTLADTVLAAGSTLSGSVVDHSGAALEGVVVWASSADFVTTAVTDERGEYTLRGLSSGTYTLYFDADGLPVISEWWDDALREDAADQVTVSGPPADLTGYDAVLVEAAVFAGTVLAAGEATPVSGVEVIAYDAGTEVARTMTGSDGGFALELAPGTFAFRFDPPVRFEPQWFDGAADAASATPVTLAAGEHSAANEVVLAVALRDLGTALPTISGNLTVGGALEAHVDDWTPAGIEFTYQWLRGGAIIPGATAQEYTIAAADAGTAVSVRVTGVKPGYRPATATSLPSALVTGGTLTQAPTPEITGVAGIGQTLTAVSGEWGPGAVTLSYQWKRNGVAIAGAVGTAYKLAAADANAAITVSVMGSRPGFASVVRTSAPLQARYTLTASPFPTISGVPTVGQKLTAIAGAWKPAPVVLGYVWLRDGAPIPGATAATYVLTPQDAGTAISVTVRGAKTSYHTVERTSSALIVGDRFSASPLPAIVGVPTVGEVVSAATGVWTPAADFSYQWLRAGAAIPGATSPTYTITTAEAGKALSVRVTGSAPGFTPASVVSAVKIVGSALTSTPTPTVAGTPVVGQKLSTVAGAWGPAPVALTYQWMRNGVPIPGATGSTHVLGKADAGATIHVAVTGRRTGYTAVTRESAATAVVSGGVLTAPAPTITGAPTVGATLTAVPGVWGPGTVSLTYQWLRDGAAIEGATGPARVVEPDDAGSALSVRIEGIRVGFATVTKTSPALAIGLALEFSPAPVVSGSGLIGTTLVADPGSWDDGVTFVYQWRRNGAAIAGAITASYRLVAADAGKSITVTVTGRLAGHTPVPTVSSPVPAGYALTARVPTISGGSGDTAAIGTKLTAVSSAWAPAPVKLTYQWMRDGAVIPGASGVGYIVTAADAGTAVTVRVTASRATYLTQSRDSADSVTVLHALTSAPVPLVTGTPSVGSLLTATVGEWAPGEVQLAYQWRRNGVAIAGATSASYQLVALDAGKTVSFAVTGTLSGYTSVTRASSGIAVALPLTATPSPIVSGTPAVGQTLTAAPGTWGPAPVTLGYQWTRDGVAIPKATAAKYVVVAADAGATIRVVVTGSRTGYSRASTTSVGVEIERVITVAPVPVISGVPSVGEALTAVAGVWGPGEIELSYQWRRSGVAIPGATGHEYAPVAADVGKPITVTVVGTRPAYTALAKSSAPVTVGHPFTAAPTPTVSGVARVGTKLTATAGIWGPAPVALSYQWKRDGVAIRGATAVAYTVVAADAGATLTVTVTGKKALYTSTAVTSAPTAAVTGGILVAPVPTISGLPTVDSTLTVSPGVWGPGAVSLSYQWKRAGVAIPGEVDSTYVVTVDDIGATITVSVTGSRAGFTPVVRTSAAKTAAI